MGETIVGIVPSVQNSVFLRSSFDEPFSECLRDEGNEDDDDDVDDVARVFIELLPVELLELLPLG